MLYNLLHRKDLRYNAQTEALSPLDSTGRGGDSRGGGCLFFSYLTAVYLLTCSSEGLILELRSCLSDLHSMCLFECGNNIVNVDSTNKKCHIFLVALYKNIVSVCA